MKKELDSQLDEGIVFCSADWGWEEGRESMLLAGLRHLHIPSFCDYFFATTGSKKVEEWGEKILKSLSNPLLNFL